MFDKRLYLITADDIFYMYEMQS